MMTGYYILNTLTAYSNHLLLKFILAAKAYVMGLKHECFASSGHAQGVTSLL